jgi:hypothetical protein
LSRQQSSDGGLAARLTATSIAEDSIAEEDLADERGGDDDYAGGEVRVMAGSCGSESLFGQFEKNSDGSEQARVGSDSMRAERAWSMRMEHAAAASEVRAKSRSVHSIAEEGGGEEEGENGDQYQGGGEGECAIDDDMENVILWIKQLEGTPLHVVESGCTSLRKLPPPLPSPTFPCLENNAGYEQTAYNNCVNRLPFDAGLGVDRSSSKLIRALKTAHSFMTFPAACELDLETYSKLPHPYRKIEGTWRVHIRVVVALVNGRFHEMQESTRCGSVYHLGKGGVHVSGGGTASNGGNGSSGGNGGDSGRGVRQQRISTIGSAPVPLVVRSSSGSMSSTPPPSIAVAVGSGKGEGGGGGDRGSGKEGEGRDARSPAGTTAGALIVGVVGGSRQSTLDTFTESFANRWQVVECCEVTHHQWEEASNEERGTLASSYYRFEWRLTLQFNGDLSNCGDADTKITDYNFNPPLPLTDIDGAAAGGGGGDGGGRIISGDGKDERKARVMRNSSSSPASLSAPPSGQASREVVDTVKRALQGFCTKELPYRLIWRRPVTTLSVMIAKDVPRLLKGFRLLNPAGRPVYHVTDSDSFLLSPRVLRDTLLALAKTLKVDRAGAVAVARFINAELDAHLPDALGESAGKEQYSAALRTIIAGLADIPEGLPLLNCLKVRARRTTLGAVGSYSSGPSSCLPCSPYSPRVLSRILCPPLVPLIVVRGGCLDSRVVRGK